MGRSHKKRVISYTLLDFKELSDILQDHLGTNGFSHSLSISEQHTMKAIRGVLEIINSKRTLLQMIWFIKETLPKNFMGVGGLTSDQLEVLLYAPLVEIPLYVGRKDAFIQLVLKWRLSISK